MKIEMRCTERRFTEKLIWFTMTPVWTEYETQINAQYNQGAQMGEFRFAFDQRRYQGGFPEVGKRYTIDIEQYEG